MDLPGGIIDTMIGFPRPDLQEAYRFITDRTKDSAAKAFAFPAEYMFKDVPEKQLTSAVDPVALTVSEMDRWGVERGVISVNAAGDVGDEALRSFPDRFVPLTTMDPNDGMDGIRHLVEAHKTWGVRGVSVFPAGTSPQVAINDKKMYPIYAKCVELGIAVFCCAGVPGPRLPMSPQRVELIDEVMYDFPELTFVTRHGCEPWTDLAIKLMLKWPGLHYSTSAFAPRHYPKDILDFANTRGSEKVLYAGYFPMGLSLERIMTELKDVPLKADVWPRFLRTNALRVLGL